LTESAAFSFSDGESTGDNPPEPGEAMAGETAGRARSSFVTALAWIFIVLGGFATLMAIAQNVMVGVMPVAQQTDGQAMPAFARFMMENFRLFFAGFLVLSAVTLAAAIGLLLRRNWARVTFIGLMAFGIFWNVAGLVLTYFVFSSFALPAETPPEFVQQHELMTTLMTAFMAVVALAFSAVFGWIIKRLISSDIRREFVAA
jgi:hypothetical protein